MSELRELLDQGHWDRAYALGREQAEQLGNPEFDFYYGVAALNAGNPAEGLLALERYVLVFPDNRSARFQLARAYLLVGEDPRARDEFDLLLPDATGAERIAVMSQLDAIRQREGRYRPTASAFVEATVAHDNNINAGIAVGSVVNIPGLGTLPPLADNAATARTSSGFRNVSVSAQGSWPLSPGLKLEGTAAIEQRTHLDTHADVFDLGSYSVSGGLAWTDAGTVYRISSILAQLEVDSQRYLSSVGVGAEMSRTFSAHDIARIAMTAAQTAYERTWIFPTSDQVAPPVLSDNRVRAANVLALSGRWTHAYGGAMPSASWCELSLTNDDNRRGRDDLSRRMYGLGLGATIAPTPATSLTAIVAHHKLHYQDPFVATAARRSDTLSSIEVEAAYQATREARLGLGYTRTSQDSNIGLFTYGRDVISLKLRYTLM